MPAFAGDSIRRRMASRLAAGVAVFSLLATAAFASGHPLTRATRLHGVTITEYFPVPERWFVGRKVPAPGLPGLHRVDWLYSATGVSMEGDGVGLDGRSYHIDNLGSGGWVTDRLGHTAPGLQGWAGGSPAWRSGGYWSNARHGLTFPLDAGGWANGTGVTAVPPPAGITFAPGPSRPLRYYRTIAVDPALIPLGSRVYIAAYRATVGHGWFTAVDTGGAILGRHIDVYRSPPGLPGDSGNLLRDQSVVVYPPGSRVPAHAPPPVPTLTPAPTRGSGPPGATAGESSRSPSGGSSPTAGARPPAGAAQAPKDNGGATPGL